MRIVLEFESLDLPDNGDTRGHVRRSIIKFLQWRYRDCKGPCPLVTKDWGQADIKVKEVVEPGSMGVRGY